MFFKATSELPPDMNRLLWLDVHVSMSVILTTHLLGWNFWGLPGYLCLMWPTGAADDAADLIWPHRMGVLLKDMCSLDWFYWPFPVSPCRSF